MLYFAPHNGMLIQNLDKSTPSQFQTIIYATADIQNVGDHVGDFVGEPTHHRT